MTMDFHSFRVDIAIKYGTNAALILQNICWWVKKNKANDRHYHDGCYWTYNSRAAYAEMFPYMSERQIKTALEKLTTDGIIKTGDYNTDKWVRPTWYTLTEKGWSLFQSPVHDGTKKSDRADTNNVPIDGTKMSDRGNIMSGRSNITVPSYTDISTDISTDIDDDDDDRAREEQDVNPYGESDYRPVKGTVQRYATENLKYMSPRAMEELNDFVDDLGEDLVRHGINNALDAGANTWSYVKAILNRYVDEGIKTVGEAKAYDEKFRQSRREKGNRGNTGGRSDKPNPYRQLLDTKTNSSLPPLNKSDEIL